MKYSLSPTDTFLDDAALLHKSQPKLYAKLLKLLEELKLHPRSGTGHPERLKYFNDETWSRLLNKQHRLVYEIIDDRVIVVLLKAYGHYDDK